MSNQSNPSKVAPRQQLAQLLGFLRAHSASHVRLMLAFSVLANVTILAPSFHMLQVYDRVLASGSIATLTALTFIAILALLAYGLAEIVRSRLAQRISAVYAISIAPKMFARFERLPQGDQSVGGHLRDFAMVKSFFASRVFVGLFDLPFIPLFIALLYFVHPLVCLITTLGLITMLAIGYFNVAMTEQVRQVGRKAEADATGFAQSAFSQGDDLRAMGLLPQLLDIWGAKTADALIKAEDAASGTSVYFALSRTVRQVIQVGTMATGGWLVVNGNMTGGMIVLASMISGRALAPVEQLIGGWELISKSIAAAANMEQMVGPDKSLRSRPHLPAPQGALVAKGLTVSTSDGRALFNRIDLTVAPGEIVAIYGPPASGKSLLLRILAGATTPQSGQVSIGGVELSRWPIAQRGQMIGFFGQRTNLMAGTLMDNIARFSEQPDMQEVYRVANITGAHKAILSQPAGYQTHVFDPNLMLSASQTTTVALARALYGRPRVLLLDHATSDLDYYGERMLLNALVEAKRNGAAIVLTTRSNLLSKLADRRLRINASRLEAFQDGTSKASANKVFRPAQSRPMRVSA